MVQNRQQLLAMASEWVNHAMTDLRQQINSFVTTVGTDLAHVAEALAISNDELEAIMSGSNDLPLTTLAKILIATDNVLEIKPAAAMPHANRAPRGEGYPHPHQMPMGAPRMGGMPMPPRMGGMPMPPRMGGMPMPPRNSRAPQSIPQGTAIPYDELGRTQLISYINEHGWSNEIDVNNATRGELIDFLEMKELPAQMPSAPIVDEGVVEEATNERSQQSANSTTNRLAQMLAEELERNPHLRETIERYL